MTLHGWRQLATWSIEYGYLSEDEKAKAFEYLANDWEIYCQWIIDTYRDDANSLDIPFPDFLDILESKTEEPPSWTRVLGGLCILSYW